MANWSNPTLSSTYTNFLSELKARDEDLAKQFDGQTVSNLITGTIRWNSTTNRWQKWSGSAWAELTGTYALTALTTTGNASIGGTLAVTGATTLAAATATTPATGNNSTAVATTAYVRAQSYAPLASPALTGTPTVPSAAVDTNTTQAASTAFVVGQAGSTAPVINGTAAVGSSLRYSREDHVHPTDTSRAPVASPTLTGTPAAPTAAVGTNTTQLATTAFVNAEIANDAPTKTGTGASGTWGISVTGNAATVTTNANLTGHITSVGNAAVLGSFTSAQLAAALTNETGSGSAVFATSPSLTTPAIGAATGTSLSLTGDITIGDKIIHAGDTNTAIRFPAADTIAFETDGSERARLASSGALLVGTTSTPTGAGSGAVVAEDRVVVGSSAANQIIAASLDSANTITATTGTVAFKFKSAVTNSARSCYVKVAVSHRNSNSTPSNQPAAEYAFQLHMTGGAVCSINSATTIFEHTYVRATHLAFADLGSGECTVTLTNPLAIAHAQSAYKVEILSQAGNWTLDSVTTT
jgi:hypothetical protein